MRKLLNTIYVTNEQAYLSLEGETLVCRIDDAEKFRIPFDNVEGITCFCSQKIPWRPNFPIRAVS